MKRHYQKCSATFGNNLDACTHLVLLTVTAQCNSYPADTEQTLTARQGPWHVQLAHTCDADGMSEGHAFRRHGWRHGGRHC